MRKVFLFCLNFCISIFSSFAKINFNVNVTDFLQQRAKRTLIFEGGGDVRFVIGPIFDVDFDDPIKWRSMVVLYNLHGGIYNLPTTPLYPWDKFEDIFARSMRKLRLLNDASVDRDRYSDNVESAAAEQYWSDDSRLFVYKVLESFLNRRQSDDGNDKGNGHSCLLRSICENAQVQQHVGIFAEILNVILTPGKENIDAAYGAAYKAGKSGVDCLRLYENCPMGSNILDMHLEYL